jgi:hypothetical protein
VINLVASLRHFTTVKSLVASLHHFKTVKDSENPSCQPTPFYTVYCPFHSLAASQYHFTTVQDSENPCCQPTPFYTVYCPIIYLDLSIRLKKVHGFLSFLHWKLRVFLRFSHGFFPTASRTYANNIHRNLPQSAHKRCFVTVWRRFVTVNPVFFTVIRRNYTVIRRHYTGYLRWYRYNFNVSWRGGKKTVWKTQKNPQFSVQKREKTVYFF